uniref:THIF-type NAD/FAD binding fold domain-containing protein n=1 Tax=uncultured Poseidoniia archaeon TaxID=1697135 RepID=A0A1B1TAB9_9ARCH|nr:hypothetical protein [uncultured Candidatus Thalassoarchaea sp.]
MKTSRFLRQKGLIDQRGLICKNILLSGSTIGVSNLLVLLDQIGFGHGTGSITIFAPSNPPKSPFIALSQPNVKTWHELADNYCQNITITDVIDSQYKFDYHLSINPTEDHQANLYSYFIGPRAKISRKYLPIEVNEEHILQQATSVIAATAMIHQMLEDLQLLSKAKISDAWVTVTCRIESTDIDEVKEQIFGLNGELLDFSPSSDGLAILARYRIRKDIGIDPYDFLNREMVISEKSDLISEDIGIVPWDDLENGLNQTWAIDNPKFLVLGAGALGSWSMPLLCHAISNGQIDIVDGDDEIEIHNLNRQLLYGDDDIGLPKAEIASKKISSINESIIVNYYQEYLNPRHISSPECDIEFDDLDFESSNLPQIIRDSDIYFSCLDNMLARKMLSDAATIYDKPMINGATEAFAGIAEQLGENTSCMVCRYGRETATSTEVVSCTEEGERPIASIVTSSAWTGAMMAALGMIHFHPSVNLSKLRYTLDDGKISSITAEKPPWFSEDCIYHI